MTKMTARLMPTAELIFLDTPKNGQHPKNLDSTKLSTKIALSRICLLYTSMAVTLEGLGVDALGINCSLGPKEILPMAKELLGYTSLPILIQPNAGLPQMDRETGKEHYDVTPDAFADTILEMVKSGVQLEMCIRDRPYEAHPEKAVIGGKKSGGCHA